MLVMDQTTGSYDASIREELDKVDWNTVLPKVLKYAALKSKFVAWMGDRVDPEELVHEAIARAYGRGAGGTYRNWNQKNCPDITDFLNGIIRSMISHIAEHEKSVPKESLFREDGSLKDDKISQALDGGGSSEINRNKDPEETLIDKESQQLFKEFLDKLGEEDEDLAMVIMCIEDGIRKPRFIAQETKFEIKKINNLLKKLRRKLKSFKPLEEPHEG